MAQLGFPHHLIRLCCQFRQLAAAAAGVLQADAANTLQLSGVEAAECAELLASMSVDVSFHARRASIDILSSLHHVFTMVSLGLR